MDRVALWIVRRPSVLGERPVRHVRLEKDEVVGLLTEVKERPGTNRTTSRSARSSTRRRSTAADGGVYLVAWHAGIAPPGPEVRAVVAISLRVVHDLGRIAIPAMIFDDVPDAALRALGTS